MTPNGPVEITQRFGKNLLLTFSDSISSGTLVTL